MHTQMEFCERCQLDSHDPGTNSCDRCSLLPNSTDAPAAVEVAQEPSAGACAANAPSDNEPTKQLTKPSSTIPVHAQPSSATFSPPPPAVPQAVNPNRLFDEAGRRTAHFLALARAIFVAIDQAERPRNTGRWEQCKMELFRKQCSIVTRRKFDLFLDICYDELGCATEVVNNKLTLTLAGFTTYLEYEIKIAPSALLPHLAATMAVYSVSGPALTKADFPEYEDDTLLEKHAKIKSIYEHERELVDGFPPFLALRDLLGYPEPRKFLRA